MEARTGDEACWGKTEKIQSLNFRDEDGGNGSERSSNEGAMRTSTKFTAM